MATQQSVAQRLYDLLVTRGFNPKTKKNPKTGRDDPLGEARVMSFDYVSSSGRNYGTAVIILGDDQELMLFFGDNLGRGMEPEDKDEWYQFLQQLRQFATRNDFSTFTPFNLNQLKHHMAGMAAIKEGLFEGYYGTRQVSYMGKATEARLMIRHNRNLGEGDARHRHIQALFIETQDGERFRLPFVSLAGGRAMLEHVRQGGRPYDIRGSHIANMIQEAKLLSRFRRASQGRVLEGVTQEVATRADVYYQNLRENLRSLATSRGYQTYFETWTPDEPAQSDSLVEDLKQLFVEQTLDARIEAALPLLARIQERPMQEAEIFENWANNLAEGTWNIPDTPEAKKKLEELLAQELPVGPDATNAREQLYDLFGDDELFDRLVDLAERDPDADARDVIRGRASELGVELPEAPAQPTTPEPVAAAEPAPEPVAEPTAAPAQPPVAEGDNLATFVGPNESEQRTDEIFADRQEENHGNGITADQLEVGDDVIITGPVQFEGATGIIDSFGRDKRFVVVNLYNHGKHSFHSSDVEGNDYADSEEEEHELNRYGERDAGLFGDDDDMREDSTDPMDHRGAVTDSFYEDLARIKSLALSK